MRDSETDQSLLSIAFQNTRWSQVLHAGNPQSPESHEALEKLCQAYWPPLYCYLRRSGHKPHEAEDLTQAFFADILARRTLAKAAPERGRFRSFLITALKHFVINEWRHQHTQKRGGEFKLVSIDEQNSEGQYLAEPADKLTPELLFDKRWALTVLDQVMARLRQEYIESGKRELFEDLSSFLLEKHGLPHAGIGAKYGLTQSAVGVAIFRLRRRYAALLREQITHTIDNPADLDDEIRHLIAALGNG